MILVFNVSSIISFFFILKTHKRFVDLGNVPSSDTPILILIGCSVILNITCYNLLPLSLEPLIKSYIVSMIHAFISIIGVLNYIIKYEINFKQVNRIIGGGILGTGDETMVYNICYSCGYFIYDLLLMFRFKSVRTNGAIIHHITILIGFLMGLFNRVCHTSHFYFLAEELSTIPLNLKSIYHNYSDLHNIFSILFMLSFFLSRLLYGSIIFLYGLKALPEFLRMAWYFNDLISLVLVLVQTGLCIFTRLLNIYWAFLIFKKVFVLKSHKKRND